jgi:DNA-binding NarL/FixJ family response regulator
MTPQELAAMRSEAPLLACAYFDGPDVTEDDRERLNSQLWRVYRLMRDGKPRTLKQIADAVRGSESSVSARLRDLRKARFGGHQVERRRVAGGLWEYRTEAK